MADAVRSRCWNLPYVRFSRNLQCIRLEAFFCFESLTSIFITPSCTEIYEDAFWNCKKLIIFVVPRHIELVDNVIGLTALFEASPLTGDSYGFYGDNKDEVNEWITTHHGDNQFSLYRACSSYNPIDEVIFDIVKRQLVSRFQIELELLHRNIYQKIHLQTLNNKRF